MDNLKTPTTKLLSSRPLLIGLAKILLLPLSQLPFARAVPFHLPDFINIQEKHGPKSAKDASLWAYLGFAAVLVLLGGAFAGLTIALMGQDEINLQVIETSGEAAEKKQAGRVLRLLRRGKHWVLVTLLLSNVITNETLPIVLDWSLGGGWPAVLGSTALVVIFGEIVPQSICVRYGLPIGAWMSPFVLILMYIMAPIAWPTAKLLDYLLGEDHGTVYKKSGLKSLVALHRTMGDAGQQLNSDEVTIISSVLDLKEKPVGRIMTPMDYVFTLSGDDILDDDTMDLILSQGYSRIPIHAPDSKENFIGMLLVKMLITYDPEDCQRVRDFALATLPETRAETSCLDIINFFQEGKSHIVLISDRPGEDSGALGVVTLEDVIEELIGEEIIDESDVFVDVHKAIRRMTPAPRARVPKGKIVADSSHPNGNEEGAKLIDIDEDSTLSPDVLQKTSQKDDGHPPKPSAKTMGSSPRRALPQLRRNSTDDTPAEGELRAPRRTNTGDLRGQLKHLGPSNLASRPKATRWASVKIKPGSSADSRTMNVAAYLKTSGRQESESTSYHDDIGESTLQPAGSEAKDGVQALQQAYGSTGQGSPLSRRPTSSASKGVGKFEPPNQSQDPGGKAPEDNTDGPGRSRSRPGSRDSAESTAESTLGSLPDNERTGTRSRRHTSNGPARSGNITENIIDSNGVQKVVLELTSSNSNEEQPDNGTNEAAETQETLDERFQVPRLRGGSDGQEVHDSSQSAKKKRKRRKRQQAKGENEPLLGGDD